MTFHDQRQAMFDLSGTDAMNPAERAKLATIAYELAGLDAAIMDEALAERMRQIATFNHTPQADDALSIRQIVQLVDAQMQGARDYSATVRHELTRRYLVKTMATAMAAIERIDRELASEAQTEGESN